MSDTTTTTPVAPAAPARRGRKRRGYSTKFPKNHASKAYLLDDIPAGLWISARARARREGLSMRALLLHLLTEWEAR